MTEQTYTWNGLEIPYSYQTVTGSEGKIRTVFAEVEIDAKAPVEFADMQAFLDHLLDIDYDENKYPSCNVASRLARILIDEVAPSAARELLGNPPVELVAEMEEGLL